MFDQRVRKAIAWIVLFGCSAVPLGFEFKEAAGYKARQQTQSSQNRPEKKSDDVVVPDKADDRIARYTFWLAMLTGGLVVVSAVQIFFLIRADKTARIMAETAQRQATTMGSWADAADKQMFSSDNKPTFSANNIPWGSCNSSLRIVRACMFVMSLSLIPWEE